MEVYRPAHRHRPTALVAGLICEEDRPDGLLERLTKMAMETALNGL